MAYFDELMQRAITVRNNVAPSSNTAILVGGVLVSIVSALQLLLDSKQDDLTFDTTPTDGSTNPVTSNGIYEAIAAAIASIDLSACEKIINKVTAIDDESTDVQYPSAKCVYDALQAIDLSACEKIVNKVTSLSAQSTDAQYPSARCVWQLIIGINAALTNLDARVTALEQGSATIYYIKGTSSKSAGQAEQFIVTYIESGRTTVITERPEVDAYGNWQIIYANKKIYDLSSFALNNSTVLTISFNEADDFSECVAIGKYGVYGITRNATALTAITFGSKDDSKLTNIVNAFKDATNLTSIDLSGFTFSQVTDARGGDAKNGVFGGCVALTYVNMSNATLERVTQIDGFFGGCVALTRVDLGSATLAAVTSASYVFYNCVLLAAIDLSAATFDAVTNTYSMFYNCNNAATINLASAAFDKIDNSLGMVRYTNSLTTFIVPENATAIAATANSSNTALNFGEAPLNYASMQKIANWLRDFTGGTAHTVTFKTSAWNAITAAEQSNIDTILSGKNWTRVLA